MMENFKNIMFIFPVMLYYVLESAIIAVFVTFLWNFILVPRFNYEISYLQWVVIIWIAKVILFDVFKLLSAFTNTNPMNNQNTKE